MTKIRNLEFVNRSSKFNSAELLLDEDAIPNVMQWYGAYCCGDRYTVRIDGKAVRKDHNGEIRGSVPPSDGSRWITS